MFLNKFARKALQIQICHKADVRKKRSPPAHIIQRTKELKLMFGRVIETKREKMKRLKLERKGKIPLKVEPKTDSELQFWAEHMTNSHSTNLKFLNLDTICTNKQGVNTKKVSYKVIQIKNVNDNVKKKNSNILYKNNRSNNEQSLLSLYNNKNNKNNLYASILATPILSNIKKPAIIDESYGILSLTSEDHSEYEKYPSVTKILNATMSDEAKSILDKWEKKMIAKLGIEGFQIYQRELLQNGKHLHTTIQDYLLHKPLDIHESIKPAFKSVNNILKDISDVKAIESHVVHPQLHYRGYLDCIASYRGKLCIIDWKKSDKLKKNIISTYDAPLQVASYIGALNADNKYSFKVEYGLIVVAYTNGQKATVHEISRDVLKVYWKRWLERLLKFRQDFDSVTNDIKI